MKVVTINKYSEKRWKQEEGGGEFSGRCQANVSDRLTDENPNKRWVGTVGSQ